MNICGYPGQKQVSDEKRMWKAKGKYMEKKGGFIFHQIPTSKGQSGSPIFKIVDGNAYVVGIHVKGEREMNRNRGILLNTQKMREMS